MAGGGGGGEDLNRKQKLKIASSHDSVFASDHSNPFLGSSGIVSFGAVAGVKRSRNSFFQSFDQEDNFDQYFDEYLNQSEKKRRLSMNQLQFLEKSFESENKLEPERKIQLAKELGLQPRQIAIWFQNRRARWKTKQLETDYETLHASYMNMKNNYDNLLKENEELKAEVLHLKHNFQTSDSTSKEATNIISEDDEPKVTSPNEDKGLAKSDARNENIPTEGIHTFGMESGDSSSKSYEPDQSDLSKNREDSLSRGLLQSDFSFPKTGDAYYHPPTYSCYYGYLVEDQPFSFWSY